MVEIIPAIIPKSFEDLEQTLVQVQGVVPIVHIDINNGTLTSVKSWPYIRDHDADFVKIIREEEGFPSWEDFEFEFHLMVSKPEDMVQEWISAGARRIIVQYESFQNPETILPFAKKFREQFGGNGSLLGTELGMALSLDTDISVLDSIIEELDFVHFMSIARIGSQGVPFEPRIIEKIQAFREKYPDMVVSVDGGINLENAARLVDAGADRLIVGSAIFQSSDIIGTIDELEELTNG